MVVVGYITLSLCQNVQLVLDVEKSLCHGVFLTVPSCLCGKCLLYDLLYEQILHDLPRGPVICLKIRSYVSLCLVDSTYDFPMALVETIAAYESLVLTLLVKYPDLETHITVSEILEIRLQTVKCDPLIALRQRKVHYIILVVFPVENAVIKILNRCSVLLHFPCIRRILCLSGTESGCHVSVAVLYIRLVELPLDQRVDDCVAAARTEKLLHRLLLIQSTVRYQVLKEQEHENTLSSSICQIVQRVLAIHSHGEVIVLLCTKVIFYIVDPYPVDTRHPLLHLQAADTAVLCIPQNNSPTGLSSCRLDNTCPHFPQITAGPT